MIPSSDSGPSAPEHFTVYNKRRGYFGPTTMEWNFDAEEYLLRISRVLYVSNLDPKFCKHVPHSNANFIIIYPFYFVPSQRVSNILRRVNKSNLFLRKIRNWQNTFFFLIINNTSIFILLPDLQVDLVYSCFHEKPFYKINNSNVSY